jgi:hypothetical protein
MFQIWDTAKQDQRSNPDSLRLVDQMLVRELDQMLDQELALSSGQELDQVLDQRRRHSVKLAHARRH